MRGLVRLHTLKSFAVYCDPPDAFLVQFLANVFNAGVIVSPGSRDINFIVLSLQQTVWRRN